MPSQKRIFRKHSKCKRLHFYSPPSLIQKRPTFRVEDSNACKKIFSSSFNPLFVLGEVEDFALLRFVSIVDRPEQRRQQAFRQSGF